MFQQRRIVNPPAVRGVNLRDLPGINHLPDPGGERSNILWRSTDPLKFVFAEAAIATGDIKAHYKGYDMKKARACYGGGTSVPFLADPCFLLQNGKPAYFYAPSGVTSAAAGSPKSTA